MKQDSVYMIGSMEGRTYEEVEYEHYYIRHHLADLGLNVLDPLCKEKHKPGKKLTLHNCGVPKKKVNEMDLKCVEQSRFLFWITGDIVSEGSETEFAGGGWWNRWNMKPTKYLIIVSPKRYFKQFDHFQNMWKNVHVFKDVQSGIAFIKKVLKRGKQ